MPYFITHYFDFKSRCANKPYWSFIITTQILFLLLSLPYFGYFVISLAQDEAMLDIIEQLQSTILKGGEIPQLEMTLIAFRVMGETLMNIQQAGVVTFTCTMAAFASFLLLLIPSTAMTTCRLRDAGSSQLWWLSIIPSYLVLALLWLCPDCSLMQGNNFALFSTLCNIPVLLLFAMLCKPSLPASNPNT